MVKPNKADLVAVALPVAGLALYWAASAIPAPVTSADWAAWVQGTGTIAAVGVAAWVGLIPLQLERSRKARDEIDFVAGIDLAFDQVDRRIVVPVAEVDRPVGRLRIDSMFQPVARELEALEKFLAIPILAWPGAKIYSATSGYVASAREMIALYNALPIAQRAAPAEGELRTAIIHFIGARWTFVLARVELRGRGHVAPPYPVVERTLDDEA